jgi:hypothetical protein
MAALLAAAAGPCAAAPPAAAPASGTTLAHLIGAIRTKAKALEGSSGMRLGFQSLTSAHRLSRGALALSDFAAVRLLFEATRDAGFWNLHWTITDRPPNSDNIWRQWKAVKAVWPSSPTASAECDELSALYAFLVGRAGIRGIGLLWPTWNHTVAVWVLRPPEGPEVRVVVPTTQIFLRESDLFDTRRFDPWRQKAVHEYTRRDVPDSTELPRPLFDFFLQQVDKYAGASDTTLQRLRYLREGVFLRSWTAEAAAREAVRMRRAATSATREDLAALEHFAYDMSAGVLRR